MMSKKKDDEIFRERQAVEGQKGGLITYKKHGKEFYSKIAKDRWKKWRKERSK